MTAIIDSGATASFVTANLLSTWTSGIHLEPVLITAKAANQADIIIKHSVKLPITIVGQSSPVTVKFLVITTHDKILGHSMLLGLDSMKLLGISLHPKPSGYTAYANEIQIGSESQSNQLVLGILTQEEKLTHLLSEYNDIFEETITSMMRVPPMEIHLTSDQMIKAKLRSYCPEDIIEIGTQLKRLEENHIIEPSVSHLSSSCHLVPKKTGQKRLVINFIPLNAIAIQDHYPLPRISNLFETLRNANYFTALDCTEGFFQVPIKPEDKHKTAFVTPQGLYQFTRCPFGFTNSPAVYQRAMNNIFQDGLYTKVVIYIDDILVFGKTIEELMDNTRWVFDKCREYTVKLKKSKCEFMKQEITFLGFKITPNHVEPVKNKFEESAFNSIPTTRKDIERLLGKLNFYSKFIPDYAEVTKPIRNLARNGTDFDWTPREQSVLLTISYYLNEATPLLIPDSTSLKLADIRVLTHSVGVIISDERGEVINRASLTLSTSAFNYTVAEKALLAIQLAYDKFSSFMRGKVIFRGPLHRLIKALALIDKPERIERILLLIPPNANYELQATKEEPTPENLLYAEDAPDEIFYTDGACIGNGTKDCIASWAVLTLSDKELSASGLVTDHTPTNNVAELTAVMQALVIANANNFKRIVIVTDSKYAKNTLTSIPKYQANSWKTSKGKRLPNEQLIRQIAPLLEGISIDCRFVKGHADDPNNIKVDQMAKARLPVPNEVTVATIDTLTWNQEPDIAQLIENLEHSPKDNFIIRNSNLYYIDPALPEHSRHRLVVPKSQRKELLRLAHDDPINGSHLGVKNTRNKLLEYYWPGLTKDVEYHIINCETCQRNKRSYKPKMGLMQYIPVSKVFERVHLDIVGPISSTPRGNQYIITCVDALSRYAFATAEQEVHASHIIEFILNEIVYKHGLPGKITTDNGTQFVSRKFTDFTFRFNIQHSRTCDYHPAANGRDERFNGTLSNWLRNYVNTDELDWDLLLPLGLLAYNSTLHTSIGASPYSVLYGAKPRLSIPTINDPNIQPQHRLMRRLAAKNTFDAQVRQKHYHDLMRRPVEIKVSDYIYVYNHGGDRHLSTKLKPLWTGPHMVTKIKYEDDRPIALEVIDIARLQVKRISFNDIKEAYLDEDTYEQDSLPGNLLVKYIITFDNKELDEIESSAPIVPSTYDPIAELLGTD